MKLTAQSYLAEVKNKYRDLRWYRDSGVAYPLTGDADRVTFCTQFERDSCFNLQYTMHSDKNEQLMTHRIISDFRTLKLEGDWDRFQELIDKNEPDSLPDILACSTGISYGAAAYIPSLLFLEDWEGFQVTAMKTPEFVSDKQPVIIAGTHPWKENCRIVVSFDDMLVQSIEIPSETFRIEFKPEAGISEQIDRGEANKAEPTP